MRGTWRGATINRQVLFEADAALEGRETLVAAQGIEIGMNLEELQNVGLFSGSPVQPDKWDEHDR